MLPLQKPSLRRTLLELIARHPFTSALWLQGRSAALYRRCSIQAIYKGLGKLIEEGIAVKTGESYSLSLAWILNSSAFLDEAYENYMQHGANVSLLPSGLSKRSWTFHDLYRTDDFWIQSMLALLEQSCAKTVFSWIPHAWFDLIHHEKDLLYQNALRATGSKHYIVLGSKDFLDEYSSRLWPQNIYTWSFAPEFLPDARPLYINIIGESILSIKLDKKTAQVIDQFYSDVNSPESLAIARFMDIVSSKASCRITLERNPAKAARLKKKFAQFFGLKLSAC